MKDADAEREFLKRLRDYITNFEDLAEEARQAGDYADAIDGIDKAVKLYISTVQFEAAHWTPEKDTVDMPILSSVKGLAS